MQVFECAKKEPGIFHVVGTVPTHKIHCLRTIAAEFPMLKVCAKNLITYITTGLAKNESTIIF